MGQVTIGELAEDLVPYTEKGNKIVNVAIVPRKIVEDIIEECEKEISKHTDSRAFSYKDGLKDMAIAIKVVAYDLLSEFEKEVAGVEK